MLVERYSGGSDCHQLSSKTAPTEPPAHALHPASSWQPPLRKASCSSLQPEDSLQPTGLVIRSFLKRSRPQEDTDRLGESVSRKKRRLRQELVTSRLSRPYATPATHIARGAWRLGVWARQRLSGGLLLRKGAILNSIAKKKRAVSESTKNTELHEANETSESRVSSKSRPIFTSSDYDAFDYEENESIEDEDEDDVEDEEEGEEKEDIANDSQAVYSDFRVLSSSESDEDFGDASYSFDTLDASYHLGVEQGEKAIHLVMENEKQDEVSVAPVKPTILDSSFPGLVAIGV